MPNTSRDRSGTLSALFTAADAAALAIPPVWPLASSVAVNPYLGQTGLDLAHTAALLARVSRAPMTMPRQWYRDRIASGAIADADLAAALMGSSSGWSVAALKAAAQTVVAQPAPLPTVADLAAEVSGIDWPGIISERFGAWAGAYFDGGQALWALPNARSTYAAWKAVATHDLTPEITGLSGFAAFVADAPDSATDAMAGSAARLGLPAASMETYFHSLLVTLGGWAQYARYKLWQAKLAGAGDDTITDFLCIRLLWEEALFDLYEQQISAAWGEAIAAHGRVVKPTEDQVVDAILQEACERADQRGLAQTLSTPCAREQANQPVLQAAFCIDVRSEVFRRALESVDPRVQTLGFAGFFGLGASHRRFADPERSGGIGRVPYAAMTVSHHAPETQKSRRRDGYAHLRQIPLEKRADEPASPRDAVRLGSGKKRFRESTPQPMPVHRLRPHLVQGEPFQLENLDPARQCLRGLLQKGG